MNDPVSHRDLQALRDLFEANRKSDKEAIALALQAAEKAVDKANEANEKRLDGLNELRALANDQSSTYARKDVTDAKLETLGEKVASIEGRFLAIGLIGTVFGIGGVVFALTK